ncbi:uncharacterized protein G2W53_004063 [Senna tora]|uniref:Uncharacterized protein n=1 Tax=Senna tora TaxID=362788 RepID=A0A834XB41_9FABA|nr:uncharacterized protein G2W53_004063 [Senna tora]
MENSRAQTYQEETKAVTTLRSGKIIDNKEASSQPSIYDDSDCFKVDIIDEIIQEALPTILSKDPLETTLTYSEWENIDVERELRESMLDLNSLETSSWVAKHELLPPLAKSPPVPSIISPPKLELKPLPSTLKYVFLGDNGTL